MSRPCVLVCSTDIETLRSIASVLEAAGLEAQRVQQAHEALQDANAPRPDFALLDTCSWDAEALALAHRLAQARVPFVVLSGREDTALVERAIVAGAMGCFFKPLDVRVIVPSIGAWIARAGELSQLRSTQQSLLESLRDHRGIGAAVGVIMERHRLTAEAAFDTLRRQARRERQSVAKLAQEIVAGTVAVPSAPSRQ